jgi:SAM-dependent methyltransferase
MELKDRIADYWDRRSLGFSAAVKDEILNGKNASCPEIVRELGIGKGTKVLDVGCGPGYFEMMMKGTGAEFHAIDYSQDMVRAACANLAENGMQADVRRMDAQRLEYPDGTFDAVIARNVFWSLPDPKAAYREMLRVMRPGAKAYLSDGNFYLHIHDASYRRRRGPKDRPREPVAGSHYRFNCGNVDFNEIEALAEDLPCSMHARPQWDLGILSSLPCSDIRARIRRFDSEDGRRLAGCFELFFTKEETGND